MEKTLILAGLVTFLFSLFKLLEMKYIDKEWKPIKYLVRESLIVFISSFVGTFIFLQSQGTFSDFINVITDNKSLDLKGTQVFTGDPEF
jgi:uncharacterized membrane protein